MKLSYKITRIAICFLWLFTTTLTARNYYVATNGNDLNNGSESNPLRTIQKAAQIAGAGDQVLIKRGTYYGNVSIKNEGAPNAWLVYKAYPGHEKQVILDNAYFLIIKKSYVRISGIRVQNGKHGFYVEGPNISNIEISENHTYNTSSSGIIVWGVPFGVNPGNYNNIRNVILKNNKVQKACNGGYNECITLANGIVGFEISGNEIFDGGNPINGGEGIDLKEGVRDGIVTNNNVHHLTRRGIYFDAAGLLGFAKPEVKNIIVTRNHSHHNIGAGMAIMTEGDGDVFNITIKNNTFDQNSEDGFMFYKHPAGSGTAYDIRISDNTIINNNRYGVLVNWSNAFRLNVCDNTLSNNRNGNLRVQAGGYVDCTGTSENPDQGNTEIPIGKVITLKKSGGNQKHIIVQKNNGRLIAKSNISKPRGHFRVENHPTGGIALKALANNKYIRIQGNNSSAFIRVKGNTKGSREQFMWKNKGSGQVALKSRFTNKWLSASWEIENAVVFPQGINDNGWETFIWEEVHTSKTISLLPTKKLLLYPNPLNKETTLNMFVTLDIPNNISLTICNVLGQQIFTKNYGKLSPQKHHLEIFTKTQNFNERVYFLNLKIGNTTTVKKIIIN